MGLFVIMLMLVANARLAHPSIVAIFVLSALSSVLTGIHRPAMEALTPQMVTKAELPAAAALGSIRYAIGAVAGPALGGWLMAQFGTSSTYGVDALTYLVSLAALGLMRSFPLRDPQKTASLQSIKDGFNYAVRQPVLVGTYLVDIIAMVFAMPMALFPAMSEKWGGASAAGWLYGALPMGAAVVSILSGSLDRYRRQGAGVILAATLWGLFICALAFARSLPLAIACLAAAGAADAVSAIYRQTIWNQIIPDNFRGRLAGLNMLSYMIGPLLGNARAGLVASATSNFTSIFSGGILCSIGVLASIALFPQFWHYRAPTPAPPDVA